MDINKIAPDKVWQKLCPVGSMENHTLKSLRYDPEHNQWATPAPLDLESEEEVALPAVLVWKLGEEFRVYDQHCPHQGAKMCAIPFGTKLVCSMHRWSFDLESGTCLNNTRNLESYPTKIKNGMLWAYLPVSLSHGALLHAGIMNPGLDQGKL